MLIAAVAGLRGIIRFIVYPGKRHTRRMASPLLYLMWWDGGVIALLLLSVLNAARSIGIMCRRAWNTHLWMDVAIQDILRTRRFAYD